MLELAEDPITTGRNTKGDFGFRTCLNPNLIITYLDIAKDIALTNESAKSTQAF